MRSLARITPNGSGGFNVQNYDSNGHPAGPLLTDSRDIVDAVNAIRQSEEFNDLVQSLRSHAAHTLRELASLIERPGATTSLASVTTEDLVERVKNLVGRD